MSDTTSVATINPAAALEEIDEFDEMFESDELSEADFAVEPTPAKLSRSEKNAMAKQEAAAAEKAAAEAERARVQALVPWEVVAPAGYNVAYDQKRKIDTWADNDGRHPRRYRSYSREEWAQAIAALAESVTALEESDPDYQRRTGLYVEEHGRDLLLIKSKKWKLLIAVPAKASTAGKKIELSSNSAEWSGQDSNADSFAELLTTYVTGDARDTLLDICCQYMTSVRIRVNRATWAAEHPDLAHLLSAGK